MMHSPMTGPLMAGEGQPLFHDFLGMNHSEPKHQGDTLSYMLSRSPRSGKGSEDDLNGDSSIKASLVTSERPEQTSLASALLTGPLPLAVTSCSDHSGSERLSRGNCGGLLAHGDRSAFYRPDIDSRLSGRKRDSSTSNSRQSLQDELQLHVDPSDNSRGFKMSCLELKEDKRGHRDIPATIDDFRLAMQPPRPTSTCPTLLQPSMHKSDFMTLNKWERPVTLNTVAYGHSNVSQFGGYPNTSVDNTTMPPLLSRPAADEGSRTGLQASGMANLLNNGASATVDKSANPAVISPGRLKFMSQSAGSDSTTQTSHQIAAPASRQLTVFYGGQAHVFDDVPPGKADAIMALAGSNGRSWSTTYSPRRRSCLQSCASDGSIPALERDKTEKEETRRVKMGP